MNSFSRNGAVLPHPHWRDIAWLSPLMAVLVLLSGVTAAVAALPSPASAASVATGAASTPTTPAYVYDASEHPAVPNDVEMASKLRPPAVAGMEGVLGASPCFAAEDGGGFLSELKGRISAARMGGSDSGAISLGGNEFSDDEIAQLTYQHIGEGDIPGRPSLDEISAALKNGQPVPLPGQNAVQYEYGGVRVIVNGDAPWRSTAYYPGK